MERRKARILALEMLYQMEIRRISLGQVIKTSVAAQPKKVLPEFALRIAKGVSDHLEEINQIIEKYAEDWSLNRMPFLDRNIIRIALYEMFYEEDIPFSVSINEAVELAKAYGTEDSGKFINGVLGKIAHDFEHKNTKDKERPKERPLKKK